MRYGSKRVKSAKDMPFRGFVKKWSPLPPLAPKFRKFCIIISYLSIHENREVFLADDVIL